jgi:hypothetical protein
MRRTTRTGCLSLIAARMCHPKQSTLEAYACSFLAEAAAQTVEEHLLTCADCREKLANEDRIVELIRLVLTEPQTHHTEDGLVRIWVAPRDEVWVGTIEGATLVSSKVAKSPGAAMALVCQVFRQAFPGHVCDHRCAVNDLFAL